MSEREEKPDDIVGHKTIDTGEICHQTGRPKFRHEPLTRAEADALWEACESHRTERAERLPDEKSAILAMFDAFDRLRELGWREAIYCPKDGTHFQVIEAGSTGIHDCHYMGVWPDGYWLIDDCPSRPILFKLYGANSHD